MNILVFTPTPTHPATQGNRQRVFDLCRAFQGAGAELTLLHYATEEISADIIARMRNAWGDVEIVFPRGFVHRRCYVRYPGIDDWFDDSIGHACRNLFAQRRFDVCLVNYVWYSKLFELLPRNVVKVLDTHDIFGGRADYFSEIGLDPVWFHTSVEQESIGLNRADFVIAIQEVEAEILRRRTRTPVRTVGYLAQPDFLPVRQNRKGGPLKVGYIGSGNPFNVASILAFASALQNRPESAGSLEVYVAGEVCKALRSARHPFVLAGIVQSVADFYRAVDVVVNPMIGGTGLKIKSLEALLFGKPLVATAAGMVGIATANPAHRLKDSSELVDCLIHLARHPELLGAEAASSRQTFLDMTGSQTASFRALWSDICNAVGERTAFTTKFEARAS